MNKKTEAIIRESEATALATHGPSGLNVVPISVVEIQGDEIHMYDFFMGKTASNIQSDNKVAMVFWQGFVGLQIKATAAYETAGDVFDAAVVTMKERFPDRTLKAVIRLTPTNFYDVAPAAGGEEVEG